MALLDTTLASLAPGVTFSRDLPGRYPPRRGLAIYCLPIPGYSPSAPGVVLGEALASRSGLGCTMLEGVPAKIPEGAVVIAQYNALKAVRPDLLEDVPELRDQGQYVVKMGRSALITSPSREGLAAGMQTLAMLVLRHGEDTLPGTLIVDTPACQFRCLAVELRTGEIGISLLMQMVSFAATFKANRLHFILDEDFRPEMQIPGIETFIQACQSYGIGVGVRVPWLGALISGERSLQQTWTGIRAAARVFGATQAGLDDPCPADADPDKAKMIMESVVKGEVGLRNLSVDARLIHKAGCSPQDLRSVGTIGWHRMGDSDDIPPLEFGDYPVRIDVQAWLPGFSSRPAAGFHRRLDTALGWLRGRPRREIMISFRNLGVSHLWQNLLFPAATGLIAAWGCPKEPQESAKVFSNLLYGECATSVMAMWDSVTAAFPPGLNHEQEALVRRTAFGHWPEDNRAKQVLLDIDWLEVTKRIRGAAEHLKNVAECLSRNASTLAGAKLSLHALSWLHCFVALTPELEKRRRGKYDEDGRTEPIANELFSNFLAWRATLRELITSSGLEISEMSRIEALEERLRELCEVM